VGYCKEDSKISEFIILGTSKGELHQLSVTKNNSVLLSSANPYKYKDGTHQITALRSDPKSGTLIAGTATDHWVHLQVNQPPQSFTKLGESTNNYPTMCTSIAVLESNMSDNFYILAYATGVIKILTCPKAEQVAELQAHSRSINALTSHTTKPLFATVGDDTMVNLWYCKFESGKQEIKDIELLQSQIVPDHLLVGAVFGQKENSLIVAPYDYKFMLHFNNLF